jgi:hypothetical protein
MSRIRPILITAIVTIVAMLPLAMGDNEYVGAIGAPFAITVIGGLAMSTMLTLVFIPTFYFGLDNAIIWMKGLPVKLQITQLVLFLISTYLVYTAVNCFSFSAIIRPVCLELLSAIPENYRRLQNKEPDKDKE